MRPTAFMEVLKSDLILQGALAPAEGPKVLQVEAVADDGRTWKPWVVPEGAQADAELCSLAFFLSYHSYCAAHIRSRAGKDIKDQEKKKESINLIKPSDSQPPPPDQPDLSNVSLVSIRQSLNRDWQAKVATQIAASEIWGITAFQPHAVSTHSLAKGRKAWKHFHGQSHHLFRQPLIQLVGDGYAT